ncbi:11923_t:CDS:2 [Racocetra fulgida]|uniref:11923_t:CDS:1 n=1 Tax=Racocetra fulgida TaxID=60492 RepID=A0A9N9FVH7_9GLOM|nr:11923_t:CDS:2 [Racocetra fulgida]
MKENFKLVTESMHIDKSRGEVENALNISQDLLEKRQIVIVDIANDPVDKKDYQEDLDPTLFHSEKTVFGWTDKWFGMTMEDIRALEDKTKLDLDESLSKPIEVSEVEAGETVVVRA